MRQVALGAIEEAVCGVFGLGHGALREGGSPRMRISEGRAVYVLLAREMTIHGYVTIGEHLGRPHTTMVEAMKRARANRDTLFLARVEAVRARLTGRGVVRVVGAGGGG